MRLTEELKRQILDTAAKAADVAHEHGRDEVSAAESTALQLLDWAKVGDLKDRVSMVDEVIKAAADKYPPNVRNAFEGECDQSDLYWRPIETVPESVTKSGRSIIGFDPDFWLTGKRGDGAANRLPVAESGLVSECFWSGLGERWVSYHHSSSSFKPTRWMPLPGFPTLESDHA